MPSKLAPLLTVLAMLLLSYAFAAGPAGGSGAADAMAAADGTWKTVNDVVPVAADAWLRGRPAIALLALLSLYLYMGASPQNGSATCARTALSLVLALSRLVPTIL
jgi:hypothetical protein